MGMDRVFIVCCRFAPLWALIALASCANLDDVQTPDERWGTVEAETSSSSVASSDSTSSNSIVVTDSSFVSSSSSSVLGTTTDSRDGQTYKTVVIGLQTWMAQNLNYSGDDGAGNKTYTIGWCYGVSAGDTSDHSDSSTCDTYGRYYSWADAMGIDRQYLTSLWGETDTLVNFQGICPDGWHIPSAGEWSSLVEAVGGEDSAGAYLKSTSGWNNDKNGLDSYGFTALPASVRNVNGNWNGLGYYADFWEASEYDGAEALFWNLYSYRTNFISDYDDKAFGMSLRCLKTE